jgi:hypothetical protein
MLILSKVELMSIWKTLHIVRFCLMWFCNRLDFKLYLSLGIGFYISEQNSNLNYFDSKDFSLDSIREWNLFQFKINSAHKPIPFIALTSPETYIMFRLTLKIQVP